MTGEVGATKETEASKASERSESPSASGAERPKGGIRAENLGYLTIMGDEIRGLVGGFLIVNRLGCPVEFHCSAPIRPNRAQEILYGATLRPFLYGRQIATALLRKGKTGCFAIFTESPEVAVIQESLATPLLIVLSNEKSPSSENGSEEERTKRAIPGFNSSQWHSFQKGEFRFALFERFLENGVLPTEIEQNLSQFQKAIDLVEPFERIALAIEESQKN